MLNGPETMEHTEDRFKILTSSALPPNAQDFTLENSLALANAVISFLSQVLPSVTVYRSGSISNVKGSVCYMF